MLPKTKSLPHQDLADSFVVGPFKVHFEILLLRPYAVVGQVDVRAQEAARKQKRS